MIKTAPLLLEIGCEELPPAQLWNLSQALLQAMQQQLDSAKLNYGTISAFATPRRLALLIEELDDTQPAQDIERRGPPQHLAYDADNNPSVATQRFAASFGVSVDALSYKTTDKGNWLVYQQHIPGQALATLLPELITQALRALPIKKTMRWGDNTIEFVRPVHWIVLLYGTTVIPATLLGQTTDRITYGHRFHAPQALRLEHASDYANLLQQQGKVIADFRQRRSLINAQVRALASRHEATAVIDDDLLDQVTGMVEWPIAVLADFDPDFLTVPAEALICAIRDHQNCFHLVNAAQQLLPHFIFVSNIMSRDPAQVVTGNQRVMHARLADARFFYQHDCAVPLDHWLNGLKTVLFQQRLGSLWDKTQRVIHLASYLNQTLQLAREADVLHAARYSKVDLLATMVGEFPELQGIMGEYYARHANENAAVACAIREHYLPRFANDATPSSALGKLIAVADKVDTLVSLFAAGQRPTGDKDPFALRRTAIAVLRILTEVKWSLHLTDLITYASTSLSEHLTLPANCVSDVHAFIIDRLNQWYREQGISDSALQAVLACQCNDLWDIQQRVQALAAFLQTPHATALAAAHKRVHNLLKGSNASNTVHTQCLREPAEQRLAQALSQHQQQLDTHISRAAYAAALELLAQLQQPIDDFFAQVMINVEDDTLRHNRLALLSQLHGLFLQVADFSLLTANDLETAGA